MRADKFLSNSGLGSRKEIKALIKSGSVSVNGIILKSSDIHINEESDIVTVNGRKIAYQKYVYLMLNKPAGYISAVYDKKLPTVIELVPEKYSHFKPFPVGRLDIDTEGLLILTNDGDLTHKILSPKNHINKTYFVKSALPVSEETKRIFENGVILDDGYKTMPAFLKITNNDKESFLTVQEGKFHQVKRMFKSAGNKVEYLKRIKMGSLLLDKNLAPGEMRELNGKEINMLSINDKENDNDN